MCVSSCIQLYQYVDRYMVENILRQVTQIVKNEKLSKYLPWFNLSDTKLIFFTLCPVSFNL